MVGPLTVSRSFYDLYSMDPPHPNPCSEAVFTEETQRGERLLRTAWKTTRTPARYKEVVQWDIGSVFLFLLHLEDIDQERLIVPQQE